MATGTKNLVVILGYIYGTPKFTYFENTNVVVNFAVKTFTRRQNAIGGFVTQPEIHRCEAWNTVCPNIESAAREGNKVFIQGKLATQKYRKDGARDYTFVTKIICEEIMIIALKPQQK